ncbi:MAG: hypothetical protein K2X48_13410 [Chitinophagaceae bacterium]|nr:hypothetical protein [Chitinophagaceae bacterium]
MTTNLKQLFRYLLCAGSIVLMITACKKDKSSDKQKEVTVDQVRTALHNELFINNMFNGSLQNQSKAKVGGRIENRVEDLCPGFALSVDSAGGFRITLGFDYGAGCPNDIAAGIVRKGKVEYSYQFTNNAVSVVKAKYISFTDAFTNYNGQLALAYQYTPATGNAFFAGTDGLNISNSFYGTALYKAALTYKQKQGMATPFIYTDDVYE